MTVSRQTYNALFDACPLSTSNAAMGVCVHAMTGLIAMAIGMASILYFGLLLMNVKDYWKGLRDDAQLFCCL